MGRWGSGPSLPILLQVLGAVLGTCLGVAFPAPLGLLGPGQSGAVRMASDVTPTLPFTNLPADPSCVPKGGRHMRKNRDVTHTIHIHSRLPQPVGTRAHAIHDPRKLAPADKSSRGADSALLNLPYLSFTPSTLLMSAAHRPTSKPD